MRRHPLVHLLGAIGLLAGLLVRHGGIVSGTLQAQTSLSNNFPGHFFAPYVDMAAWPTQSLVADAQNGGITDYSLAFITSDGACTAAWGGVVPLTQLSTYLPDLDSDIQTLRSQDGDVIISFGGEAGTELAQSCTTEAALQAQYQSIIDHYHVSHLDFDIEGAAGADSASIDLRNQALAALQAANPGLVISYTLPVLPTGLVANDISLLQNAIAHGVNVGVVNIMTMDYGGSFPPNQMGQNAIDAANNLIGQLQTLYPAKSAAQIRAMVGITPMTGANDVPPENFTLADASAVLAYARQTGIGELAMWSVNRDEPGFSYAAIFNAFNNNGAPATVTPTVTSGTQVPSMTPGATGTATHTLVPSSTPAATHSPVPSSTATAAGTAAATGTPRPTTTTTSTRTPVPAGTRTATGTPDPGATITSTPTATVTPLPTGNLVANGGFESGSIAPWSCQGVAGSNYAVVRGNAHSGVYDLALTPTNALTAQCQQQVSVRPNTAYTLSAWVKGAYAFVGVSGTGATDASTWASSSSYTKLNVPFTTGPATASVTVWVHGWYAQGPISVDDVAVS
jgi:hypothetical protein